MARHEEATDGPQPRVTPGDPCDSEPIWEPDEADLQGIVYPGESIAYQRLAETRRDVNVLAAQLDRAANLVQGKPSMEDYDALHAELATLRGQFSRLEKLLNQFLPRVA